MDSPERSSTLCGTAHLKYAFILGVVLPKVSTPCLHSVGPVEEYREPVHNHDAREVDVIKRLEGCAIGRGY